MLLSSDEDSVLYNFIFEYVNMLDYRQKAMFVYEKLIGETCDIKNLMALSNDRRDSLQKELKRHELPVEAYQSFKLEAAENGVPHIEHHVVGAFFGIIDDPRLSWRDKGIAMYYTYAVSLLYLQMKSAKTAASAETMLLILYLT